MKNMIKEVYRLRSEIEKIDPEEIIRKEKEKEKRRISRVRMFLGVVFVFLFLWVKIYS